jgi:hypothetical protein
MSDAALVRGLPSGSPFDRRNGRIPICTDTEINANVKPQRLTVAG